MEAPEGLSHMDGFPEDLKEVVNEHWAQYPPQKYAVVYFFGICFTILTFVNVVTNSFIIYIYLSNKDLCIPANMLMVNLAVTDMLIFITHGPLMAINAFTSRYWIYGPSMCKLYGFCGGVFGTCALITLVFIGYERYQVICYGLAGERITKKKIKYILAFIWIYSVVSCLPPFFGWGGYKLEGLFMTCSYEYVSDDWSARSFILFAFLFSYVIPLMFLIYFYYKIILAIFYTEAAFKRAQTKLMDANRLPVETRDTFKTKLSSSKTTAQNGSKKWELEAISE